MRKSAVSFLVIAIAIIAIVGLVGCEDNNNGPGALAGTWVSRIEVDDSGDTYFTIETLIFTAGRYTRRFECEDASSSCANPTDIIPCDAVYGSNQVVISNCTLTTDGVSGEIEETSSTLRYVLLNNNATVVFVDDDGTPSNLFTKQ